MPDLYIKKYVFPNCYGILFFCLFVFVVEFIEYFLGQCLSAALQVSVLLVRYVPLHHVLQGNNPAVVEFSV